MSHDTFLIEHPYVYKTETKGQKVKHILTKGWPSCIFCSAKDESSWPMWPEIQSRFFITSPNMIQQKYKESNILIGQKKGYPQLVQEQIIVSSDAIQLAQDCILAIREELQENYKNNVWIPFQSILAESLSSEKGTDVRTTNRIFSLLNLTTKINSVNRHKLILGNETLAISLLSDLKEVLRLTQGITGILLYKLDFFKEIFIPLLLSKDKPLEKDGITKDKIAVYSNELADYYKEKKERSITTDALKKTYLTELKNNGLIDEFESKVDKRRNGFYSIVDVEQIQKNKNYTNLENDDNNLQLFKLKLSNNYNYIDKNWLKFQILDIIKYGIGQTNKFKLLDENKEICICRFIEEYNKSGAINQFFEYDESCIYSSKVFGNIIKM